MPALSGYQGWVPCWCKIQTRYATPSLQFIEQFPCQTGDRNTLLCQVRNPLRHKSRGTCWIWVSFGHARRLEEAELTAKAVAAAARFARDEGHAARLAAARAAGHLALAELRGGLPAGSALPGLLPVMVALLGADQSSEVQRQMLLVGARSCLAPVPRMQ